MSKPLWRGRAVEASANINIIVEEHKSKLSDDESSDNMFHENEAENIIEEEVEKTAEPQNLLFKCDQWEFTKAMEKGLSQHKRSKHRISQIDRMDDFMKVVIKEVQTEEICCEKCSILLTTYSHTRKHIEINHCLGPTCDYEPEPFFLY